MSLELVFNEIFLSIKKLKFLMSYYRKAMKIVDSDDTSNSNEINVLGLFNSLFILEFFESFKEKDFHFKFFIVTEYCQVIVK